MLKAVFFDLDGTLLDSEPDFTYILNKMLRDSGKNPVTQEQMQKTVSSGARAMVKLAFAYEDDHPEFQQTLGDFLDCYAEQINYSKARLYNGVDKIIQQLKEQRLIWGIVTNKSSQFTYPLLNKFPILNNCPVVVCSDHVVVAKPDPEGLIMACQQIGCSSHEAVYIGDHPRDIEAGKNA